jgi:phosphate transport system protein
MQAKVRTMVKESLDALVNRDAALARRVCGEDDAVDELNRRNYRTLLDLMRKDGASIERAVMLLSVSRFLERIADLATNVSEDVVYFVEGEVIRHHGIHDPTTPPPSWQVSS